MMTSHAHGEGSYGNLIDLDAHRSSALAGALLTFEAFRSEAERIAGQGSHTGSISETLVQSHELTMRNDMAELYVSLPRRDQDAIVRVAALASSLHDGLEGVERGPEGRRETVSGRDLARAEVHVIVAHVSADCLLLDIESRQLLAADFLWAMAWWQHLRSMATSFRFDPAEDPMTQLLLGRRPEATDALCLHTYEDARDAELAYRTSAAVLQGPPLRAQSFGG